MLSYLYREKEKIKKNISIIRFIMLKKEIKDIDEMFKIKSDSCIII